MLDSAVPVLPFAKLSRERLADLLAKSSPFVVDGFPGVEAWNRRVHG
jgi:hypothetical protein